MRATSPFHAPRPSGRIAGEVHRALVASGIVVGVCTAAVVVATWANSSMTRSAQSRSQQSAAELSTGSLLVVSPSGTFCRNRTIDNSTWQIRDNGWVDCEEALAKSAGVEKPGSRLDLIRQSFRRN
jgi:hypothetical protein